MTDSRGSGADERSEIIDEAYDEGLLKCMDIVERNDFYGIVASHGMSFFGEKLGLAAESHLLDLCSGIGGPARFLAKTFGCRVAGIDLSEFNHHTAVRRTREACLDGLVSFQHGNVLDITFPEGSFTHVFACEALCYFSDKVHLYKAAYRALKPGGAIAFLEAACDSPVHLRTGDLLGPVYYESVERYGSLLQAAGFGSIQTYDTTRVAASDIARAMYRLISRRHQIVEAAGEEVYYGLLEIWAEFTAYFAEGKLTHCGFVARRE